MPNYKIITDSSCDFTKQQYADLDLFLCSIRVKPMTASQKWTS